MNPFDIAGLMGKVKEMQQKLQEAQDDLINIQAHAEAGAGMVKALVNGKRQVVMLEIDPDLMRPEDREMLQDLIAAAINKAMLEVEAKAQAEIQRATQSILPNIPGLDLNNLGQ